MEAKSIPTVPAMPVGGATARRVGRRALKDYLELTKPRITALVLASAAAGFLLGAASFDLLLFAHTMIGVGLVAAGTSAMNHVLERDVDALMGRTRSRPLPAGRVGTLPAAFFSGGLAAAGIAWLAVAANPITAVLAAATFVSYDFVYTPLKRVHSLSTVVGAVPGALPILGGWTAATGELGAGGWALFGILFVWQLPHFLALAWLLRDDYGAAGLRMLSVGDPGGRQTRRQTVLYTLTLIPVSLMPSVLGLTGPVYFAAALVLGGGFLWAALRFGREASAARARRLFRASILYLPLLMAILVMDKV
ncbi:heme o synthase [Candidatus Palauibacter sp.]|uniref:heme o synthase n=1 Tax=Candidatus Palauibacter sp. TaxID=3101350 RepID=UPI003C6EFB25